jgi:hypothetical protein
LACSVALLACVMTAPSAAQPVDKRTLFTFRAPVAMPGVTLAPGTYLFRLADPTSSSNVIQVLDSEGKKPFGMFFAARAERIEAASAPELRFMETPAGTPAAIKTWWYPGERAGYEFVYPKDQARRLAQGASQPVLTTHAQTTTTEQTNTADLTRVSSAGQETTVSASAAPVASTPGGASQQGEIASSSLPIANVAIPAPAEPSRAVRAAGDGAAANAGASAKRTELPRTASAMPVVALVAGLTLCSGVAVGIWRRRRP